VYAEIVFLSKYTKVLVGFKNSGVCGCLNCDLVNFTLV